MRLSDRLEAVLEMVAAAGADEKKLRCDFAAAGGEVGLLADIGTDHGLIPIEAVRRGLCKRAVASDIGEGPIKAARENIARAGLDGRIKTVIADGLAGVKLLAETVETAGSAAEESSADTKTLGSAEEDVSEPAWEISHPDIIVISGMGGMLMKKILIEGKALARQAKSLILSPQSDLEDFRKFLGEAGFEICHETCIKDEGKYYFVMQVAPRHSLDNDAAAHSGAQDLQGDGASNSTSGAQNLQGDGALGLDCKYGRREHFSREAQEVREELIRRDLANYKKIALGLKAQNTEAAAERLKELEKEISDIELILQR